MPSPDDEDFFPDEAGILPLGAILDISRLKMLSREEVVSLLDAHEKGTPEFDPHVWTQIWMYCGHLLETNPAATDWDSVFHRIDSILWHR
jgi:hypothetical protein